MAVTLKDLRPVYVAGIGFHRYQFLSETPYVTLGLTAVRAALTDAGLSWRVHPGLRVSAVAPSRASAHIGGAATGRIRRRAGRR